jgi:hypothetical protein
VYRTTTQTTKAQIAALSAKPTKPAWLKLALHDALRDKPMSLSRERRMCAALSIEAPPNEYAVPECPGCGGAPHVAREGCNGNGGTAVVLADGETVTTPRGPWVSKALPEVAAMVRGLQLCLERKAGHAPALEV